VDVTDIVAIIERRRAKFRAQRRTGPQDDMDQAALLIAEEYDILLAEIEVAAVTSQAEAERKNKEAEAQILGDQGQSGG
jgi:hypothetical protein